MSEREREESSSHERADADEASAASPGEDARRPYEAPRIVKRRSVAHATLFSVMTTATGMTMGGN